MAIQTLSCLPDSFEAGDTILFSENYGDFPAGTWTATIYFSLNGAVPTSVAATASGTGHLFTLSSAFTAALSPGIYDWATYATSGSERAKANGGIVYVLPNLASAQTATAAAQQLAAANTALTALLTGQNMSVSFNGQSFTRKNQMELYQIVKRLKADVQTERDEQAAYRGESKSRSIRPYFQ